MTSLPSACCCTPEYPWIASSVQRERMKGKKRMSGNSSHGSKCKIHLVASTTSMKRERLVGGNRNEDTQQLAPAPSPLSWGQTVPPFVPKTTSSKAHEELHHPPTVVGHCVSSYIFLILGLIPLLPKIEKKESRHRQEPKLKVSCLDRRRHLYSALQSRILPGGTQKGEHSQNTSAPPHLMAMWNLYFERRVQWFENSSDKQHKCSHYKFQIKVKHLLRHESLSYSSLKFPQ